MIFKDDQGRHVLRHHAPWQTDNENETMLELRPALSKSDDFVEIIAATNEPDLKRKKGEKVYFIHLLTKDETKMLWEFLGELLAQQKQT